MTIHSKIIEYQEVGGSWKPYTSKNDQGDQNELNLSSNCITSEPRFISTTDDAVTVSDQQLLLPSCSSSSTLETLDSCNMLDRDSQITDNLHDSTVTTDVCPGSSEILSSNNSYLSAYTATGIMGTNTLASVSSTATTESVTETSPVFHETNDPALFVDKRITPVIISLLINSPCQPDKDHSFVKTHGRSFLCDWFRIIQPDGTWKPRSWLSYSKSANSAFCMTCLLFGGPAGDRLWTHQGYRGWESGHGLRGIERHESSAQHRQTEVIRFQWIHDNRVDQPLINANRIIVEQNRRVVYIAVKTLKFLATEMMAVLGHHSIDGKFLHLFREFSEFDPCAAGYLLQLDDIRHRNVRSKPEVNLLSPLNCRRLLKTMKSIVVGKICSEIGQHKSFSLIIDGTQDCSKKDAQAVLVRYVSTFEGKLRPVERLIEVFTITTGDSSGKGLCDQVVPILQELKLDFDWIIGQSYDGASNMRGMHSGLQAKLREVSKKALYIWCQAHRLNLLVQGVLKSSSQVTGTINLLQELYNFFNGYKRNAVLVAAQENEHHVKTLKRVSETTRSWRSVEDGVSVVMDRYDSIITALEELSHVSKNDATTVSSAEGLLRRLQDFDIIVTMLMLNNFCEVIFHSLNKSL